MVRGKTLITGADGYLGRRLAHQLLAGDSPGVVLFMRAADARELSSKIEQMKCEFASYGGRVAYAGGDLKDDDPFQTVDKSKVGSLAHLAAITRFNVEEEAANSVNVEGARKAMRFALTLPQLEHFALVSTIYASGLKEGKIKEELLEGNAGFANHYERSKWEAESVLARSFNELPWTIVRVSTVIADDRSGRITQQNAVHNTLKLFYYGLLSLLPGYPDTPVYLTGGDFAARAVAAALTSGSKGTVYHVCPTRADSPLLSEVIDCAFEAFAEDESFKRRRVLRPLYASAEEFEVLASGISALGQSIMSQSVASVSPFAKQLFLTKDFETTNLRSLVPHDEQPIGRGFLLNAFRFLVKTRRGRDVALCL